jgi:hypothetical protein
MGRHASYVAAQQGLSTVPAAAATHVGRVGALALALGIGAAVAGGAGIANADGPTDNSPGGPSAQSSPDSSTGDGTAKGPRTGESHAAGSRGAKTRKHESFNVPTTRLGNSGSAPIGDLHTAGGDPGSLPGLISGIPKKITAALLPDSSAGAGRPSTSPTRVRPTPRSNSRASAQPTAGPGDLPPVSVAQMPPGPWPSTTTAAPISIPTVTGATQAASTQTTPALAPPVATVVASVSPDLGFSPSTSSTGGSPKSPTPMVLGVLQLVRREIENISLNHAPPMASLNSAQTYVTPTIAPAIPTPADQVPTVYGAIGKWMLEFNGQISDYGGQPYGGKKLLEPVNVIIVDPTSKTSWQAARKLNTAMFWGGFPAQPIHSTGFRGILDGTTYGQQPKGLIRGYSDNFFLFTNDHGRIFGPDPVQTSTGYVWSGAFSTEQLGLYNGLPTHTYVSSSMARTALAMRLILSGQATYGGLVNLDNSYNTATTTTGDHDGYAVVLVLK